MKVEFINLNGDPALDPEIKLIPLSSDETNKPPPYCLPWVEASRYSMQIKSNEEYFIEKKGKEIQAWVMREGKRANPSEIWTDVPKGQNFVPKNGTEAMEKKVHLSVSPAFSSPWQEKTGHSVTLKVGIYWWTPPGWGLFFTSAVHRNESFRVVEGFVRTDLWHRDVPILIQPLVESVTIAKFSVVASALPVRAEDIELISASGDEEKRREIVLQVSKKRLNPGVYKKRVAKSESRD